MLRPLLGEILLKYENDAGGGLPATAFKAAHLAESICFWNQKVPFSVLSFHTTFRSLWCPVLFDKN
jgi:hypothetical protein